MNNQSLNSCGELHQLERFFIENEYCHTPRHSVEFMQAIDEETMNSTWRLADRMKVAGVALVVCLNVGTDPPDILKPTSCARRECWFDPFTVPKQKALETIGNFLAEQYKKWQPKALYKLSLDPTADDLRRTCASLRKFARSDRLLLHYNGHGVPRPTVNGDLWVFGKNYTHYMPLSIHDLRVWIGDPAVYVLDCSGAGMILPFLAQARPGIDGASSGENNVEGAHPLQPPQQQGMPTLDPNSADGLEFTGYRTNIILAACKSHEILPMNPLFPADLFTACLTTPIPIAVRWFITQNQYSMADVPLEFSEAIPGEEKNRKSPLGELNWVFTTITDTIAWSILPWNMFQKLFREDLLISSLFRNFLLARRIMKGFNCTPQSWPPLPDTSNHPLWQSWDLALEAVVANVMSSQRMASSITSSLSGGNNGSINSSGGSPSASNSGINGHDNPAASRQLSVASTFFAEQLTAFEIWLDFRNRRASEIPIHLPILLQVLLSKSHRVKALLLLRRYLAMGPEAVNLALLVGIFPYILRLVQCPASDIKQILVHIWAFILGFDPSGRSELVRDKLQSYFIKYLAQSDAPPPQRCMCAFVLAQICNGYREGQEACLQLGLHRTCCTLLAGTAAPAGQTTTLPSPLRKWIALCLAKLCQDFVWAKYLCLTEAGHTQLYPLLVDPDPIVRSSAVLAMGEFLGASESLHTGLRGISSTGTGLHSMLELSQVELQLAVQILESCTDGCAVVRREAVIALARFIFLPVHYPCMKLVVSTIHSQEAQAARSRPNNVTASGRVKFPHQWMLTPTNSHTVVRQVKAMIEARSRVVPGLVGDVTTSFIRSVSAPEHLDMSPSSVAAIPGVSTTAAAMAPAYVRLWLALKEVQLRDPHSYVQRAAAMAINRLEMAAALDRASEVNNRSGYSGTTHRNIDPGSFDPNRPQEDTLVGSARSGFAGNGTGGFQFAGLGVGESMPLGGRGMQSPWGSSPVLTGYAGQPTSSIGSSQALPRPPAAYGGQTASASPYQQQTQTAWISTNGTAGSFDSTAAPPPRDVQGSASGAADSDPMQSHLYDWSRRQLLEPTESLTTFPLQDPLTIGALRHEWREYRKAELLTTARTIAAAFEVAVPADDTVGGGGSWDFPVEPARPRTGVITLSPSITRFEQKAVLNLGNSFEPSSSPAVLLFHAFRDFLAVSYDDGVDIWSLSSGTLSRHVGIRPPRESSISVSSNSGNSTPLAASPSTPRTVFESGSPNLGSVTALQWLNEFSDNTLLLTGSNDGCVRLWRNALPDDYGIDISAYVGGLGTGVNGSGVGSSARRSASDVTPSLAAAFIALPDMAEGRVVGSGLLCNWRQAAGSLVVAGNSGSVRLWDLDREQCVRALHTGMDTCVTALLSESISQSFPHSAPSGFDSGCGDRLFSWVFTGFANGSVALFDERQSAQGGRVLAAKEHDGWVVASHLSPRGNGFEVVTASVTGDVKFWDIRKLRSYKTIEIQKSMLTSLALHNSAPIMASGSAAQFIKIMTLNGEQLGHIRYHDGFLGQRIGPVTSVAFHPMQMMLASVSTDNTVSIYVTADGQQ